MRNQLPNGKSQIIENRIGKRGFALIEVLVVIVIIGILAAVAVPVYINQTIKARPTEVTNAIGYVVTALAIHHHGGVLGNTWPDCGSIAEIQTSS